MSLTENQFIYISDLQLKILWRCETCVYLLIWWNQGATAPMLLLWSSCRKCWTSHLFVIWLWSTVCWSSEEERRFRSSEAAQRGNGLFWDVCHSESTEAWVGQMKNSLTFYEFIKEKFAFRWCNLKKKNI